MIMPSFSLPPELVDRSALPESKCRLGEQIAAMVCLRTGYAVVFELRSGEPTLNVLSGDDQNKVTLAVSDVLREFSKKCRGP